MKTRVRAQVVSRREALVGAAALTVAGCVKEEGGADLVTDAGTITPITPNEDHYITSCCGTPTVDGAAWTLTILDRGQELAQVTYAELEELDARDREHTLECISAGPYNLAISNAVWTGLPLLELFEHLGVTVPTDALELKFTSEDDYTTAVPIGDLELPIWLVWRMNGQEIPPEHGFPARLLVPGRYGMKNPKWIRSIEFTVEHHTGYWESRGWSEEAVYLVNGLVHAPRRSDPVPAGAARVLGTAFAGTDPVVSVEVSVDDGAWQAAVLDYAPGADIWTLWHHDVELAAGAHAIQVRCTTASGAATVGTEGGEFHEGYSGGMRIEIEVV